MKTLKIFAIALAACVALVSCSKNNADSGNTNSEVYSSPAVKCTYTLNDNVRKAMTMTLSVDGTKACDFSKAEDSISFGLTPGKSGTITFESKYNSSATFTEAADFTGNINIVVGAIKNGTEVIAYTETMQFSSEGMPVDKIPELMAKKEKSLSLKYTVANNGQVTVTK